METNIFATAVALSDRDLLARIDTLAVREREATAELLGHLAALELRPSLYLAQGYGSLFEYCTQALHLSEDAACMTGSGGSRPCCGARSRTAIRPPSSIAPWSSSTKSRSPGSA